MMVEAAGPGELPGLVLLSDRQSEVVDAYGVKPLEINGARYASRATFVIDKEGVLQYVNYDYQIREDYEPLMEVLSGLE
jgi:peroxiredoxin